MEANKTSMHKYDANFYQYINSGATRSAGIILPLLTQHLSIHSVIDFGCGQGAWLAAWGSHGATKTIGIDGPYVDQDSLLIDKSNFWPHDLAQPIDLEQKFDLVQSLEVAEHLPKQVARDFIASLVRHGDLILFSAAVPGQGGENHINEQPYEFWRLLFAEKGYVPIDAIRPYIYRDISVEPWYRYNSILYVNKTIVEQQTNELKQRIIGDDSRIPDYSPPLYKLRKNILRLFPVKLYTLFAKLKKNYYVLANRYSRAI